MPKIKMKSRFMSSIIGGVMLTLLTPTLLTAQDLRFGTSRVPRSCPSRSAPKTGAISVEQAKMYFTCHVERGDRFDGDNLNFVTNLKLQVAPRSRRANGSDVSRAAGQSIALDQNKPIYDIRGSYTDYFCGRTEPYVTDKTNCMTSNMSAGKGICFQDTFGDWFCLMTSSGSKMKRAAPPQ